MKKRVNPATVAAAFLILAVAEAKNLHAQTDVTVTVDYSDHTGPSQQMASGFLHGISATHPAQYLIDGVKVSQDRDMAYVSGEAPGVTGATEPGQYEPNLFDPATYSRVSATGAKLMVGFTIMSMRQEKHTGPATAAMNQPGELPSRICTTTRPATI
jgi:hypothetical protein